MPDSMYRTLYEHSMDAMFLTSPDGGILAANPAACEMFRRTEAQICRLGRAGLVDEDDAAFHAYLAERTRKGKVRSELTFIRGDGSRFSGEASSAQFTDDAGELRTALIIHDLTERKRMEEALRDSEQRYRMIFENSPVGLFRSTLEGQFIEANPALAHIYGYETSEALIREIHDIGKQLYVDEADRQRVVARQLQSPGDSALYINRYRRRDGTERIANLYLKTIRNEKGTPVFFEGIVEDVTESKQTEEELRASEARFRSFVDHVSDALFLHGEDGVILDANHQACLNLGYRREELIGMNPGQFDAELSAGSRDAMRKRVDQGEVMTFTSRHRRKDGSTFPVEVSVRKFPYGNRILLISTARDISERLRVEGDLRRLNRELRAISHCHQALLRASDEQHLLDEICRIICDEAGYRMAWVGFVDRDGTGLIRPMAWAGVEAGYLASSDISWRDDVQAGQGPGGEAVRNGTIVYVQDIDTDPRMAPWRDTALARGYRSSIAIPLKTGKEVFGILSIYASKRDAFVLEEIRLLDELADDLAFGIDVLRMRREREQAKASLQANKEELKASNLQLRRLSAHREVIREQERMAIARNMHDELGQVLTALQMQLSMLARGIDTEKTPSLHRGIEYASTLVEKSMKETRNVISALRPASLDMGLAASLEWLAQQTSANMGIVCRVELVGWHEEQIDEIGITALYRIAQESLTNVARHAHADQATIILSRLHDACQLIIRDNGVGFDPEGIEDGSFGLAGIRERVTMLGGKFTIDSGKGKGTELRVTIPVPIQLEAL